CLVDVVACLEDVVGFLEDVVECLLDVVDSLEEGAVDPREDRRPQEVVEEPATIPNMIARAGKM
ncbi:MAG: hypothetical protein GY739_18580, partial [Mesoflavibacter sp.]|nr:hypothetical protein [Mesoflavibacter sp.]